MKTTAVATKSLVDAFVQHQGAGVAHYRPWTHERPLLIRPETNRKVQQLQTILYQLIHHFVEHYYEEYEPLMPLEAEAKRVLQFFKDKPYEIGSYRTDFVMDETHQFKLIEITCRFGFNGYWLSGFINVLAKEAAVNRKIDHQDLHIDFLFYLEQRLFGKEVVILSHGGKGEESRFYQSILEEAGYSVRKVFLEDIEHELSAVEGKLFITELNQEDYYAFSDQALQQLAKAAILNDLRTVFLIHDKRFFEVLGNPEFRAAVLTKEEIALLDEFYLPTYSYAPNSELWQRARTEKDRWILKHKHLGKSASVYAGEVTDETVWQQLFESGEVQQMVLQPFVKQPKFRGTIGAQEYEDYIVGTLLFLDNYYFGLGVFRASSHPVTNVIDDRKVMHINLADRQIIDIETYQQL